MDATEISLTEILSSTRAGRSAAALAFSELNDAGKGYDPTGDDLGELVRDAETTSDVAVWRWTDESGDEWLILVGTDGSGSDDSRWAVRVGDTGVTLSDVRVEHAEDENGGPGVRRTRRGRDY